MKILTITTIAALAVCCACTTGGSSDSTSGNQQVAPSTPLDTAAVVQRVEEIYAGVCDTYNSTSSFGIPNERLDSLYCSSDWLTTLSAVIEHDKQLPEGLMGYLEADYWIMGQDWQNLSVSDVSVTAMTDSTATVELQLHNCGDVKPVRLEMTCEYGEWKIDNFIDAKLNYDWKADMKQYLAENPLEE